MTDFESRLARFDDRLTMRHERVYRHPVALVWEAITSSDHLNRWLLRRVEVDPREGGRCSFTWGGDVEQVGTVREVDPPHLIVYDLVTSSLRFELVPLEGGTRLTLLHQFVPGAHVEPVDRLGGDQPAGPDSPWRPDFAQGFHQMLDVLGVLLDGGLEAEEDLLGYGTRLGHDAPNVVEARVAAYRNLIAEHCPPA